MTVMRPWVLNHLFNTLYIAQEQTIKEQAISESEYNKKINWLEKPAIPVIKDEDFEKFTPNEYDINSISGMTELFVSQMCPTKKRATISDRIRHICYSMKDDEEIIESRSKRSNSYRFYPKEDYTTLKKYLEMLYDTNENKMLEKHILSNSRYYDLMINRQLILDTFKTNGVKIRMVLEIDEKHYKMEAPVLGRFRKVYEMHPTASCLIKRLNDLRNRIGLGDYSQKDVVNKLFDSKKLIDMIPDAQYRPEQIKANYSFLSDFIRYLESIKDEMIRLDDLAYKKGCHDGGHFSSAVWFPADRHMMRREALWEKLVLSEEDLEELESIQIFNIDDDACEPINNKAIRSKFMDNYPTYLENNFILPILCLIELSPKAASRFIKEGHYESPDSPSPIFINDDRLGIFGAELDKLLMDALTDVMNKNTIYQFNEYSIEHHRNKTYLYRLGDMMMNDHLYPALMTFRVNSGRYISMHHSIPPFKCPDGSIAEHPFVKDPFDIEFHDCPLGIPNGIPSCTYLGNNWITPMWFYDFFIEFTKSHHNYINDAFITLLKGWILTDLSNVDIT